MDGPVSPLYSIVSFGVVCLHPDHTTETFYGQLHPLEGADWIPEALAVSGHSREEQLTFPPAEQVMKKFEAWVNKTNRQGRPMLMSDNIMFDGGNISYYLHRFLGENMFGWSGLDINDLHKGVKQDMRVRLNKLRKTKHTHHPVDDAMGNAEAVIALQKMGLRISLYFKISP